MKDLAALPPGRLLGAPRATAPIVLIILKIPRFGKKDEFLIVCASFHIIFYLFCLGGLFSPQLKLFLYNSLNNQDPVIPFSYCLLNAYQGPRQYEVFLLYFIIAVSCNLAQLLYRRGN